MPPAPPRRRRPSRSCRPSRSHRRRRERDDDLRYYSEPDAKYFEIDYEFLKELRRIARSNCPECRQRKRRERRDVTCRGASHSSDLHCEFCCRACGRSTYTVDSIDVDRSDSRPSKTRPESTPRTSRPRKNSIQSNKSVSFLESSADESPKDEPNYTAKSFTNDLKRFLLKPAAPRLSLRDKFIISFKQEFEATKKSPKLKAIRGLWKSY